MLTSTITTCALCLTALAVASPLNTREATGTITRTGLCGNPGDAAFGLADSNDDGPVCAFNVGVSPLLLTTKDISGDKKVLS